MSRYVLKNIGVKGLLQNQFLKRDKALKSNEEQFFKQYDQTFLNNQFIQDCLKQQKLNIPVDFFKESRFDDFAEDLNDFQVKRNIKQK